MYNTSSAVYLTISTCTGKFSNLVIFSDVYVCPYKLFGSAKGLIGLRIFDRAGRVNNVQQK